jgi:hypothetical protein
MDGISLNITQTQIEKRKALFPEAVSEGKVDWIFIAMIHRTWKSVTQ